MHTFYTVITVWLDGHTNTDDFPNLTLARQEYDFRKELVQPHSNGVITDIRILRVSPHNILDITPGREDQ